MGKQGNIHAADLNTNLLETFIANQQQLIQENKLLKQQFEQFATIVYAALSITPPSERVYTSKEICEILHITRNTLTAYVQGGKINCSKPGRGMLFTQTQLNDFLRTQHPLKALELKVQSN